MRIDAYEAPRIGLDAAAVRFSPAVFACQPTATTASDASAHARRRR